MCIKISHFRLHSGMSADRMRRKVNPDSRWVSPHWAGRAELIPGWNSSVSLYTHWCFISSYVRRMLRQNMRCFVVRPRWKRWQSSSSKELLLKLALWGGHHKLWYAVRRPFFFSVPHHRYWLIKELNRRKQGKPRIRKELLLRCGKQQCQYRKDYKMANNPPSGTC